MKTLIVWAHPEPASFNAAMVEMAKQTLAQAGQEVRVHDLYREGWSAVACGEDFVSRNDVDRLVYDNEQFEARRSGGFSPDIERALADLEWCDLLILQFPLWWFSVPAILKGWIDRVFAKGSAYGSGRWYDRGGYAGKRAMLSLTTAAYESMCSPTGINGAMDVILWPLQHGTLRFVGFDTLQPHIAWSIAYATPAERARELEIFKSRLLGLEMEEREPTHGRDKFGKDWQYRGDGDAQLQVNVHGRWSRCECIS